MATDKLVDFDHVTDYISREAAIDAVYGAFRVKDVDDFVDYRDIAVETIKVLRMTQPLPANDFAKFLEGLTLPKDGGVMILGPELEFCGVMPRDAEIEVIRKASEDDAEISLL